MKERLQKYAITLAVCLTISGGAFANCGDVPNGAESFVREHEVNHFNGDEPSVVQDELAFWKSDSGEACFFLKTVGPNHHECEVLGAAASIGPDRHEFKSGSCTLTFQGRGATLEVIASPGWERLGRGGLCTRRRCGVYGEVESGIFGAAR